MAALLAPMQAQAGGVDSARAFAQGLYEAYRHGEPNYLGERAGTTFAPHLLALIRHDQATTPPGYSPNLDWDPICSCQDAEGLRTERVDAREVGPGRVLATVTLRFPAEVATVKLDLVSSRNGGWRVADVRTKETPSLVALLEKEESDAAKAKLDR
jgi:hypothetical protein